MAGVVPTLGSFGTASNNPQRVPISLHEKQPVAHLVTIVGEHNEFAYDTRTGDIGTAGQAHTTASGYLDGETITVVYSACHNAWSARWWNGRPGIVEVSVAASLVALTTQAYVALPNDQRTNTAELLARNLAVKLIGLRSLYHSMGEVIQARVHGCLPSDNATIFYEGVDAALLGLAGPLRPPGTKLRRSGDGFIPPVSANNEVALVLGTARCSGEPPQVASEADPNDLVYSKQIIVASTPLSPAAQVYNVFARRAGPYRRIACQSSSGMSGGPVCCTPLGSRFRNLDHRGRLRAQEEWGVLGILACGFPGGGAIILLMTDEIEDLLKNAQCYHVPIVVPWA